jgi:hypothetical protein
VIVVTAKPFVEREEAPFLLEEKKLEPEDSVDIDPSFVAVNSLDSKFSSGSKSLRYAMHPNPAFSRVWTV